MKWNWIIVGLMVVGGGYWLYRNHISRRVPISQTAKVFGVEELAGHAAQGPVQVIGVVAQKFPERHLFSLVDQSDQQELERTGKTECFMLPVQWKGSFPESLQLVKIQGRIEKSGRGLVLIVQKWEPALLSRRTP